MKPINIFLSILLLVSFSSCFSNTELDMNNSQKMDEYYMQMAIDLAKSNPEAPFAAVIVDNKMHQVLATGLNASKMNPTFHGELVAINNLVKSNPKLDWSNATLYTTAEPCSMCQSAIVWVNIPRVVFATSMDFLINHGWNQININAAEVNKKSPFYKGTIRGGVLSQRANLLFEHDSMKSI